MELVIRRRTVHELAAMAGITFHASAPTPLVADAGPAPLSGHDLHTLTWVWKFYSRWPGGGTCLRECLVAGRLMRYRNPVLRIGVRPDERGIAAHAWLEFGGIPVDPSASSYLPLTASRPQ